MPSAHAANSFAQAALFGVYFRKARIWLVVAAVVISLSRTFVGVHYPGDLLAGAVLGSVIGIVLGLGHRRFIEWRAHDPKEKEPEHAA